MLRDLFLGLVVGAIAELMMPGRSPGGIFVAMLIGLVGAFAATMLGRIVGWYQAGQSAGFVASFLGAVLLLWGHRQFAVRRSTTR